MIKDRQRNQDSKYKQHKINTRNQDQKEQQRNMENTYNQPTTTIENKERKPTPQREKQERHKINQLGKPGRKDLRQATKQKIQVQTAQNQHLQTTTKGTTKKKEQPQTNNQPYS